MTHMNQAFRLFRLQQVDSQLDELNKRLAENERLLNDDKVIQEAQQAIHEAEQAQAATSKEMREAEEQVKAQQEKLKENQDALYGGKVRATKELQDLQREAEIVGNHLREFEDLQLSKMMALEEGQLAIQKASDNLESVKAQRSVEVGTLSSEQETLKAEQSRLLAEREAAADGISKDALSAYDGLRQTKGGLAVAKANNKTCSACGAELSASLAQAARSQSELARCSSCRRILYAG